ncbi:Uncharacterized UPF0750 membrane protein [Candidatus Syntrophocurvum alkaliphilum]|uniref:Uncharacterized UPF0750 membrane protein n=1 Tax=Candidatus Syntrophocurvum alkaliphilum TaxID=2293317 RepID=A0A6I6DQ13_9FIRM|nr:YitT family protein [Candidatus Syntrophocurvum alkaliphilum]QGU00828.1 Uncharacterized UPF0750 membrane protein [Candidatus Syntrophocurvum alkaliphilum]
MNRFLVKARISKFREEFSIKDIIGILVGSLILAFAIEALLVPANVLTAGITGLAIILNFTTPIPVWFWVLALNVPVFIAGYKFVSKRFIIYSLIATFSQALFLWMFQPLSINIDDLLLAAIFGGVVAGVGAGIIFRYKGSSGGLDIIAVIFKRFWGYNIGQTFFIGNISVLALSLIILNLELALFSAISIYIASKVLDSVEAGPQVGRTAIIISDKSDDIAYNIMNTLHKGCTYLPGQGAYSGQDKKIIMVTVGKTQLPRLKEIVFQLDSKAFISVNETIEAYGHGFKTSKYDF